MIDILLATYNGEKYLPELLDSLLSQTYQDFKIIVRDDNSSDKTVDILMEYANKNPDKFKIETNAVHTGNAKDNFFLLMNDASADYIMFCDQDDVWLPEKIELTYRKMLESEKNKPCLVHTDLCVTDKDLNITHKSFFKMQHFEHPSQYTLEKALVQNTVTGCTVMINKKLADLAKDKNSDSIIMHDWFLAIYAFCFGSVAFVPDQTILYRQHPNNSVGAKKSLARYTIQSMKQSIAKTIIQAEHICKILNNSPDCIKEYAKISKNPKLTRIITLFKNNLWRARTIERIAQILFI